MRTKEVRATVFFCEPGGCAMGTGQLARFRDVPIDLSPWHNLGIGLMSWNFIPTHYSEKVCYNNQVKKVQEAR